MVQQVLAEPSPPALRIVTRGAQPAGGEVTAGQAALLGLGRVVAIEHPELDCRLLDLPAEAPPGVPEGAPAAREAAWRDGAWHVPGLVRAVLPASPGFATAGVHLVTGGLGGLGPVLARWLLGRGAERVVLMGRRAPSAALPDGAQVVLGDVAEAADVARAVAVAGADLRGVFHLAGVLSDAAVLRLGRADLERVFAAKVEGARHLDREVGERALDAFVLFGSSAGLIGNAGQGAHAAANAWLDALAWERRGRGLAGLCVDWGAWGEAGTLTRSAVGQALAAAGAELMAPEAALEVLGRAIVDGRAQPGRAQVMVAAIDWGRFLAGYGEAVPAFFAAVAPVRRPAPRVAVVPAEGDPRASRAALAAFVAAEARRVLRVGPGEELAADMPLNEAGLDSLMALELRTALGTGLGLTLPATLLFNFPTIVALTGHLETLAGLAGAAAAAVAEPVAPPPADRVVEEVLRMSEAEMAALIAEEYARAVGGHG